MNDLLKHEETFRYQLLSRMKMDCDYYLGYGNRNKGRLWAGDEAEQIKAMKVLHNSFAEDKKPEWLTWEELLEYERKMMEKPVVEKLVLTYITTDA